MDNPEKPTEIEHLYLYDLTDRKLIISLLSEYSKKLMELSQEIERYKALKRRILLLFSIMLSTFFCAFLLWIFSSYNDNSLIPIASILCLTSVATFIGATLNDNTRKTRFLERNGTRLSMKIEKLIRMISQAEDHLSDSPVKRLELDLRLTDAESILERYKYTVNMNYSKLF